MSATRLQAATELLRSHYGTPALPEPGGWPTAVRLILAGPVEAEKIAQAIAAVGGESPLDSPRHTADASPSQLAESLARVPRARQKAPLLKAFAQWWLNRFGDETEPDWPADVERLRGELCALRGLRIALADQLLLFVGGLPVFPIDRSVVRVACRHGWLDFASEYDEWQSFFVQRADETSCSGRELSIWLAQVGRDHCGPQPRCEECPLKPLLPAGGPYAGDE